MPAASPILGSTGSTTLVLAILLVALGIGMLMTTVWLVRATRTDTRALGPLEVLGDRGFARRDADARAAALTAARPPGFQPPAPMVELDDPAAPAVTPAPAPAPAIAAAVPVAPATGGSGGPEPAPTDHGSVPVEDDAADVAANGESSELEPAPSTESSAPVDDVAANGESSEREPAPPADGSAPGDDVGVGAETDDATGDVDRVETSEPAPEAS